MAAVNASVQLRAQAARLRAVGARDLRLSMTRNLRAAAKDAIPFLQESARESLPKAGGMNEAVAAQTPKVSVRTTGRTAGVTIKSKVPGNYTNEGAWRHPVFSSNRKRWTKQAQSFPAAKDWWLRGQAKAGPKVALRARAVLDEVAAEIMRRGL